VRVNQDAILLKCLLYMFLVYLVRSFRRARKWFVVMKLRIFCW